MSRYDNVSGSSEKANNFAEVAPLDGQGHTIRMKFIPDESIRIFLALGANLGDREANLRAAVGHIEALGLRVARASSVYETEPVGHGDQGLFLNQVIEVRMTSGLNLDLDEPTVRLLARCQVEGKEETASALLADALLRAVLKIEQLMGRERPFPNAPRTLDIDLLLFGNLVLVKDISSQTQNLEKESASTGLVVPHPRLHLRRFVLEPLHEIAPEFVHPSLHKSINHLLAVCTDDKRVWRV